MHARATAATVGYSERELFFEENFRSLLLKHISEFGCTEAPIEGVCDGHRTDTKKVLHGIQRLHRLAFVRQGNGAERICDLTTLEDGTSIFLMVILLPIESQQQGLLAVEFFVARVDRVHDEVFVCHPASFGVRSVKAGTRTPRSVVCASRDLHAARVPCINISGEHIAQRFKVIVIRMTMVWIRKTLEFGEVFRKESNSLTEVFSARRFVAVVSSAMAALRRQHRQSC